MKDHPDRKGRLQLIEAMLAGHSWQEAVAQSQLHISRSTAYLYWLLGTSVLEKSLQKRESLPSQVAKRRAA